MKTKTESSPRKAQSFALTSSAKSRNLPKRALGYRLDFGKHKGQTVDSLPISYIDWLIEAEVLNSRTRLKQEIAAHYPNIDLRSSRERWYAVRRRIPSWLYEECMAATGPADGSPTSNTLSDKERLQAMEKINDNHFLDLYQTPREEYPTLPSSDSVTTLLEALKKFPDVSRVSTPDLMRVGYFEGYVEYRHDGPTGDTWWEMTASYKQRLQKCLTDIELEHDEKVRNAARWKVRDKHAQCLSGIYYVRDHGFDDKSAVWVK
ncbi:hypothetical protein GYMLUDRAFT_256542 [Collybiopsis luxurians FD-317 M1]|nr:hypothetical protein GYMLUDRAFT_256542 [Collybiopsis luxurians FD-317 M1]